HPAPHAAAVSYFLRLPLIFSLAVCVLARPRLGVNVIRAFAVTFPFWRSFCFATFVMRNATVIVGGPPVPLDALRKSFRFFFFFASEALRGAFASAIPTLPAAETVTRSFLPFTFAVKAFE